jgi:hypothetical protein
VRQQLLQISSSSSSTTAGPHSGLATRDHPADAVLHAAADTATQACISSISSSGEDSGNGQQHMSGACSEVQPGVQHAQLLWRNIQDKVLAVAWHPTNPRESRRLQCQLGHKPLQSLLLHQNFSFLLSFVCSRVHWLIIAVPCASCIINDM